MLCEEVTLTSVANRVRDSNPGSDGGKPKTLPLSHTAIRGSWAVSTSGYLLCCSSFCDIMPDLCHFDVSFTQRFLDLLHHSSHQ